MTNWFTPSWAPLHDSFQHCLYTMLTSLLLTCCTGLLSYVVCSQAFETRNSLSGQRNTLSGAAGGLSGLAGDQQFYWAPLCLTVCLSVSVLVLSLDYSSPVSVPVFASLPANVPSFSRLIDGIQRKKYRESLAVAGFVACILCFCIWCVCIMCAILSLIYWCLLLSTYLFTRQ